MVPQYDPKKKKTLASYRLKQGKQLVSMIRAQFIQTNSWKTVLKYSSRKLFGSLRLIFNYKHRITQKKRNQQNIEIRQTVIGTISDSSFNLRASKQEGAQVLQNKPEEGF